MPNVFDEVKWPEKPLYYGLIQDDWEKAKLVVKLLCEHGTVTLWAEETSSKSDYAHMPRKYEVDGVSVQFLPHWLIYMVGPLKLSLPKDSHDLLTAVHAVKDLLKLGLQVEE